MAETIDYAFRSRRRRRWPTILITILLVAILIGCGWIWAMLQWSYSDGVRAGILQKFSRKGWVCKTQEGELALYVVGGVAPQIWYFSVRDPEIVQKLQESVGQSVRLHYSEHRGLPTTCFGETPYFVDDVTVVNQAKG